MNIYKENTTILDTAHVLDALEKVDEVLDFGINFIAKFEDTI